MRQVLVPLYNTACPSDPALSHFPKISESSNHQYTQKLKSPITQERHSLTFYDTIKNNNKQFQKINCMDTMSQIIKNLKLIFAEIQQYTSIIDVEQSEKSILTNLAKKCSRKIQQIIDTIQNNLRNLNDINNGSLTPILMRRFIARITETIIIIKNRYGPAKESITLQSLYQAQKTSKPQIFISNHNQLMASLIEGVYQQMNLFRNKKNDEIVEIVLVSLSNSIKIIQKCYQLVKSQILLKLYRQEGRVHNLLVTQEKAEKQRQNSKKKQDTKSANYKKLGIHFDKSVGLYKGMNIDEQWLRSLILQSKNHSEDIKYDQAQQNSTIRKSRNQYGQGYEKWRAKIAMKKAKKQRKQKLLLSNTKAANKLNCLKLNSIKSNDIKSQMNPKELNYNIKNLKSKETGQNMKQCPSAPLRNQLKNRSIAKVSFSKGKKNFLEIKPVTVCGDQIIYSNHSCLKDPTQSHQQKKIKSFIRDQEILEMVKGISKKTTNLLFRGGSRVSAQRLLIMRRKSTSCQKQKLITQ